MDLSPEEKMQLFQNAEREVTYKGRNFFVREDKINTSDQATHTYEVVVVPEASVMVPITDTGEIIMIKQYRPPVNKIFLELPAGKLDKDETPEQTANRELQEEIGMKAGKLTKICDSYTAPGYSTERLHFYTAHDLTECKLPEDELEAIEVKHFSLERLLQMIKNRKIVDGKTVLGILFYEKSL